MSRINRWIAPAALALAALAQPAFADIFTFTDDNGVVHFTNLPSSDKRYKLLRKEGDNPAPTPRTTTAAGWLPSEVLIQRYAPIINLASQTYGPSTTAAVLAYKRARKIINPAYQTAADAIVGKMTIAALDADLVKLQKSGSTGIRCNSGGRETVGRRSVVVPPDTVPLAISARWDIFDKQRRA